MRKSIHTQRQSTLQRLLMQARLEAGLTQAQVAEKLERPQSFVSKYENGERRIDVVEFLEVCAVLKTDPHAVIDAVR